MATADDVKYAQLNTGNGVSVDPRQDQNVFKPTVHPDGKRTSDPKGVEVRSAVEQASPIVDKTEWMVFNEQGLDMGGPRSTVTAETVGSGYDSYPGAHNEQFPTNSDVLRG